MLVGFEHDRIGIAPPTGKVSHRREAFEQLQVVARTLKLRLSTMPSWKYTLPSANQARAASSGSLALAASVYQPIAFTCCCARSACQAAA